MTNIEEIKILKINENLKVGDRMVAIRNMYNPDTLRVGWIGYITKIIDKKHILVSKNKNNKDNIKMFEVLSEDFGKLND